MNLGQRWFTIKQIIKGTPKHTGTFGEDDFKWLDKRPLPSDKEIEDKLEKIKPDLIWSENMRVEIDYTQRLDVEQCIYKGKAYCCDEAFTSLLAKLILLKGELEPTKTVVILSDNKNISRLKIDELKELFVVATNKMYKIRQECWTVLQKKLEDEGLK